MFPSSHNALKQPTHTIHLVHCAVQKSRRTMSNVHPAQKWLQLSFSIEDSCNYTLWQKGQKAREAMQGVYISTGFMLSGLVSYSIRGSYFVSLPIIRKVILIAVSCIKRLQRFPLGSYASPKVVVTSPALSNHLCWIMAYTKKLSFSNL